MAYFFQKNNKITVASQKGDFNSNLRLVFISSFTISMPYFILRWWIT